MLTILQELECWQCDAAFILILIFHFFENGKLVTCQIKLLHTYHVCTSAVSESRLSNPSPSHHLWVRVRVITSKSESESSPQSQSQIPRVRVKKKFRVRVTNLVVHIFNICLSSKTWKQTTKCIECQSKQRNTARPLLLGLGRDSGPSHESRFLSPSPSQENWTRVRVRVRVKWTRVRTRVHTRVTQHWFVLVLQIMIACLQSCKS